MPDPTCPEPAPPAEVSEQRLADLELFVRGVVHDLNNALNVMKTNLYLLRQRLPEDETKITRPLARITDQVDAIRVLLEGHQSLYHARQPQCQRINLNELVRQVIDESHVPEGYELRLYTDNEIPLMEGDPKLLASALRALLRNSVRAMAGTGEIQVQTRRTDDTVSVTVEDTGPGIPSQIRDRAFEPFVSTWQDHAGLGLALVERVAQAHGGKASLRSSPGEGTQVAITLPLSTE